MRRAHFVPLWFQRVVLRHVWLSFIVMGLSFFAFGVGSLNLFYLLRANTNLLLENGWMAVLDGGAQQLVELLVNGYVSMAAYVVFKACEYRLAHWLADRPDTETHTDTDTDTEESP